MFPLNKNNEMIFGASSITNSHQQNIIPQDLINNTARANNSEDYSTILGTTNNLGQQASQLLATAHNMDDQNDDHKKKTMHREIERLRRKDMASLHAELRSLIPLEYIKGKRSMSDHMNCAVSYIKRLKITISELSDRRDKLTRGKGLVTESGIICSSDDRDHHFCVSSCLAVHDCSVGVEIVFCSSRSEGHGLPLSRLLRLLLGLGLDFVSCVTAKVSQGFLHTVQAEVTGEIRIDLAHLQHTLDETISSSQK